MGIQHSITPTVAEFRAQIEILNARIKTDAASYERDQDAIRELKDLLGEARRLTESWRRYASRLEAVYGPVNMERPE